MPSFHSPKTIKAMTEAAAAAAAELTLIKLTINTYYLKYNNNK